MLPGIKNALFSKPLKKAMCRTTTNHIQSTRILTTCRFGHHLDADGCMDICKMSFNQILCLYGLCKIPLISCTSPGLLQIVLAYHNVNFTAIFLYTSACICVPFSETIGNRLCQFAWMETWWYLTHWFDMYCILDTGT